MTQPDASGRVKKLELEERKLCFHHGKALSHLLDELELDEISTQQCEHTGKLQS